MTNEELYQLMKDGFDQINQRLDRMDERLDGMDARLRTVENGISELKGKQSAIRRSTKLDSHRMRRRCLGLFLLLLLFSNNTISE